jgi:AhpD family alkylhydroperoxidase
MTNVKFGKRTYGNLSEFLGDVLYLAKNRKKIQEINQGRIVSPAFRERIMLAVTAVNRCRYCTFVHTGEALRSGLNREEIGQLLAGEVSTCPPEEAAAVIYAQHWAESNACPDPLAVQKLKETYGQQKADAIQFVLRMIRNGNLSGNSWDYILFRVSFGAWGR